MIVQESAFTKYAKGMFFNISESTFFQPKSNNLLDKLNVAEEYFQNEILTIHL